MVGMNLSQQPYFFFLYSAASASHMKVEKMIRKITHKSKLSDLAEIDVDIFDPYDDVMLADVYFY